MHDTLAEKYQALKRVTRFAQTQLDSYGVSRNLEFGDRNAYAAVTLQSGQEVDTWF